MSKPLVSFVVPCYNLAHLLPDCIQSILSQTYSNFEVLVMDDCSPDNTPEVVNSFRHERIKHIRNNPNLGHLRNYNKGITLSHGKYVWLISADDYLRVPYILERYVWLMEAQPEVGYTCCPGVGVRNGRETEVLTYSVHGNQDRIVKGHIFLKKLLKYNSVIAASALVRRQCYEKVTLFPLETGMQWTGDWYLWCIFALFFDVGYFAEPMVCYREHALSMTSTLMRQENVHYCSVGDIEVPWMVRQKATELGMQSISKRCLAMIAHEYGQQCTSKRYSCLGNSCTASMDNDQFEDSLCRRTKSEQERNWVRARVFARMGDSCWFQDRPACLKFYLDALQRDPWMVKVYLKLFLLVLGKPGSCLRRGIYRLGLGISR